MTHTRREEIEQRGFQMPSGGKQTWVGTLVLTIRDASVSPAIKMGIIITTQREVVGIKYENPLAQASQNIGIFFYASL